MDGASVISVKKKWRCFVCGITGKGWTTRNGVDYVDRLDIPWFYLSTDEKGLGNVSCNTCRRFPYVERIPINTHIDMITTYEKQEGLIDDDD